jgi:hypothetical protein
MAPLGGGGRDTVPRHQPGSSEFHTLDSTELESAVGGASLIGQRYVNRMIHPRVREQMPPQYMSSVGYGDQTLSRGQPWAGSRVVSTGTDRFGVAASN